MFYDAQQAQEATWATHPEPQPVDPVREVVQIGAAFMLGRALGGLLKKKADSGQNRCW